MRPPLPARYVEHRIAGHMDRSCQARAGRFTDQRDAIDLNLHSIVDACTRDRAGRRVFRKEFLVRAVEVLKLEHAVKPACRLHHLCHRCAGGFENLRQVGEDKTGFAHHRAVGPLAGLRIDRDQPGQKDEVARLHAGRVGEVEGSRNIELAVGGNDGETFAHCRHLTPPQQHRAGPSARLPTARSRPSGTAVRAARIGGTRG